MFEGWRRMVVSFVRDVVGMTRTGNLVLVFWVRYVVQMRSGCNLVNVATERQTVYVG